MVSNKTRPSIVEAGHPIRAESFVVLSLLYPLYRVNGRILRRTQRALHVTRWLQCHCHDNRNDTIARRNKPTDYIKQSDGSASSVLVVFD